MPHPIIFVNNSQPIIDQAIESFLSELDIKITDSDVLQLAEKIGIEQIKKIRQHFFLKSVGNQKKVVILNPADSLTMDAQNGLLKILEEPAETSLILLGVSDESVLLPTVLSRCEVRHLNSTQQEKVNLEKIAQLLSLTVKERIEALEKEDDRALLIENIGLYYYQKLPADPKIAKALQIVLDCNAWIAQNVAIKAVADYLMIVLPKQAK